MKSIYVTLTVLFSFIAFSSFSRDVVTPAVLKTFQSSFGNATEVAWTVTDKSYRATFALNGQYITAYYTAEGELMGLTRNLSSLQLPLSLQTKLKAEYGEFWISDLFEVANQEGTSYYVTLENAETKLVLKSAVNEWNLFRKERKS